MSKILRLTKPGHRIVDDRGVPEGKPIFVEYVACPADATLADADALLQGLQKKARDAGCVWFRATNIGVCNFKLEGWDRKPEGAA